MARKPQKYYHLTEEDLPPTKSGYVYMVTFPTSGLTKIGFSRNPIQRIYSLQLERGEAYSDLHFMPVQTHPSYCERCLHRDYEDQRVTGEWFSLTEDQIKRIKRIPGFGDYHPDPNYKY